MAIRRELDPATPESDKLGFAPSDIEDLLETCDFRKQWMYDAVYVWHHPDHIHEDVVLEPIDPVSGLTLERVLNLIELSGYEGSPEDGGNDQ